MTTKTAPVHPDAIEDAARARQAEVDRELARARQLREAGQDARDAAKSAYWAGLVADGRQARCRADADAGWAAFAAAVTGGGDVLAAWLAWLQTRARCTTVSAVIGNEASKLGIRKGLRPFGLHPYSQVQYGDFLQALEIVTRPVTRKAEEATRHELHSAAERAMDAAEAAILAGRPAPAGAPVTARFRRRDGNHDSVNLTGGAILHPDRHGVVAVRDEQIAAELRGSAALDEIDSHGDVIPNPRRSGVASVRVTGTDPGSRIVPRS